MNAPNEQKHEYEVGKLTKENGCGNEFFFFFDRSYVGDQKNNLIIHHLIHFNPDETETKVVFPQKNRFICVTDTHSYRFQVCICNV